MAWLRAALGAVVVVCMFGGQAGAAEPPSDPRTVQSGYVEVVGAVRSPGTILLRQTYLSIADALELTGGYREDAYPLGAALLRKARDATVADARARCLPPAERQAMAMIEAAMPVERGAELIAAISGRTRYRVPVKLGPVDESGSTNLIDGDVLIIPPRPAHVYAIGAIERSGALAYETGWLAEDYRKAAIDRGRGWFADDRLVLPDGELRELSLNFWNYEPKAVPPGSMLIFGVDDDKDCLVPSNR